MAKTPEDKSIKFNPLGLFVMQTIAMWEDSSKLPEMREVRFDAAIEILRNTYPVSQMTGCACDETGPCKMHGQMATPAPIAAQTEKCPWCEYIGKPCYNCSNGRKAEQVDAARCPKCGSEIEFAPNQFSVECRANQDHYWHESQLLRLADFAQFFRASLKQETQPPIISSGSARPWNCICSVAFGVTPEKCGAHGSPLETPAAVPEKITQQEIEQLIDCVHIGLNGRLSAHSDFVHESCVACIVRRKLTPAPADTGAAEKLENIASDTVAEIAKGFYDPNDRPEYGRREPWLSIGQGTLRNYIVKALQNLASTGDTPQPQDALVCQKPLCGGWESHPIHHNTAFSNYHVYQPAPVKTMEKVAEQIAYYVLNFPWDNEGIQDILEENLG